MGSDGSNIALTEERIDIPQDDLGEIFDALAAAGREQGFLSYFAKAPLDRRMKRSTLFLQKKLDAVFMLIDRTLHDQAKDRKKIFDLLT
ncbi:MAG: hypothetical protein ACOVS5_05590 [Oligoflexus sp.]